MKVGGQHVFGRVSARLRCAGAFFCELKRPGERRARALVDAVFTRDYPVVQGVVLVTSLFYITLNLLADIGYILVNPRLRS